MKPLFGGAFYGILLVVAASAISVSPACADPTTAPAAPAASAPSTPAAPVAQPTTSTGALIHDLKSLVKQLVDVKVQADGTGSPNVSVKAPFVNVNVKDGQNKVDVHAPFVNVQHTDAGTAVKAPFVNLGSPNQSQQAPTVAPQAAPQQPSAQSAVDPLVHPAKTTQSH